MVTSRFVLPFFFMWFLIVTAIVAPQMLFILIPTSGGACSTTHFGLWRYNAPTSFVSQLYMKLSSKCIFLSLRVSHFVSVFGFYILDFLTFPFNSLQFLVVVFDSIRCSSWSTAKCEVSHLVRLYMYVCVWADYLHAHH